MKFLDDITVGLKHLRADDHAAGPVGTTKDRSRRIKVSCAPEPDATFLSLPTELLRRAAGDAWETKASLAITCRGLRQVFQPELTLQKARKQVPQIRDWLSQTPLEQRRLFASLQGGPLPYAVQGGNTNVRAYFTWQATQLLKAWETTLVERARSPISAAHDAEHRQCLSRFVCSDEKVVRVLKAEALSAVPGSPSYAVAAAAVGLASTAAYLGGALHDMLIPAGEKTDLWAQTKELDVWALAETRADEPAVSLSLRAELHLRQVGERLSAGAIGDAEALALNDSFHRFAGASYGNFEAALGQLDGALLPLVSNIPG